MNPDLLVGFIQYVVFLLSTTCHEAAHALAAKVGGDMTAFEGGQGTLNPLPHIRREPFGMVVMPILGITMGTGLIGWASAPYDPNWARSHPKRAAWMSLAGPAANFSIAILAALVMRIGMAIGAFAANAGHISADHIVRSASGNGILEGVATLLSIFLSLNVLLGCFNLLPVPPLDGWSALPLLVSGSMAGKLQDFQMKIRGFAFIGLLLGWRLIDYIYIPVLRVGVKLVYFSLP